MLQNFHDQISIFKPKIEQLALLHHTQNLNKNIFELIFMFMNGPVALVFPQLSLFVPNNH